jgi:tRNA-splicing ligase RtcB (3'-phosphate/5'-hydroxy nucleic acid ligase)
MFTIFDPAEQKWPIKVWLENVGQIEEACLQQAKNLANFPFAYKWIALMPDTHSGYGMPIGGVVATENVIMPNAVGVDIGCGMVFVQTNIPAETIMSADTPNGKLAQSIIGDILRNIPTGFEHHRIKRECASVRRFSLNSSKQQNSGLTQQLMKELDNACFQVGTLGSGNHFIELQTDEQGYLGIMVHSGSRNIGYTICHFFNQMAKELNKKDRSPVPPQWDLAYLLVESESGREYIRWMNLALEFARENRAQMLDTVIDIVSRQAAKYAGFTNIELSDRVNCHHNYAAYEEHYGKMVWVHRKGAIRAGKGELGIIPGAMGINSYLVKGRGNPESFCSCSHGAGRQMSRTEAKQKFSVQDTIADLKSLGVFLGKVKKSDVGEESRFAYKDLDFVIANELDLIVPVRKLKTIAVVKG